jgi:hypothetical protein
MKRLLFFVVVLLAMTSLALASPPVPNEGTFTIPAGSVFGECAFDVQATLTGKSKTITLPGDRFIVTSPGAQITLTNLSDSSKSVTLTITGTFHQSTTQQGDLFTIITGRSLVGDPDAGFVLAIGNFSYAFSGQELVQPLIGQGQLIHVCTLIS